eukprot:scaffold6323_cov121-Isochrysis_galbana.AAC.3
MAGESTTARRTWGAGRGGGCEQSASRSCVNKVLKDVRVRAVSVDRLRIQGRNPLVKPKRGVLVGQGRWRRAEVEASGRFQGLLGQQRTWPN